MPLTLRWNSTACWSNLFLTIGQGQFYYPVNSPSKVPKFTKQQVPGCKGASGTWVMLSYVDLPFLAVWPKLRKNLKPKIFSTMTMPWPLYYDRAITKKLHFCWNWHFELCTSGNFLMFRYNYSITLVLCASWLFVDRVESLHWELWAEREMWCGVNCNVRMDSMGKVDFLWRERYFHNCYQRDWHFTLCCSRNNPRLLNKIYAFLPDQQSKSKLNINRLPCVIRRLRLSMSAVVLA